MALRNFLVLMRRTSIMWSRESHQTMTPLHEVLEICSHRFCDLLQGAIKPQDLGLSSSLSPPHRMSSREGESGKEAEYEIQALRLEMSDRVSSGKEEADW